MHGFWQADIHTQLTWKLWSSLSEPDFSAASPATWEGASPPSITSWLLAPGSPGKGAQPIPSGHSQPLAAHQGSHPLFRCHQTLAVTSELPDATTALAINPFITSTLWGSNSPNPVSLLVLLTEESAYKRKMVLNKWLSLAVTLDLPWLHWSKMYITFRSKL